MNKTNHLKRKKEIASRKKQIAKSLYKAIPQVVELKQEFNNKKKSLQLTVKKREAVNSELISSEKQLNIFVNNIQDYAITTLDKNGNITSWNKGAERIKGYKANEIIGKHFSCFYPKHDKERTIKILKEAATKGIFKEEGLRIRKDGTPYIADLTITAIKDKKGEVLGFAVITQDVTKRKSIEEKEKQLQATLLSQSAKLSSIGLLGAEIAHELNSPLTGILGFLRLRKDETKEGTSEYEKLNVMVEAAEHMAKIISELTIFSRTPKEEFKELNLNDVINSTLNFSSHILTKNDIKINKKLENDLLRIKGDKGQLQQVVLNMITNAKDAIEKDGELIIKTYNSNDNKNVFMEFKDNGKGIEKENLEKIFDPFFTTKLQEEGTGLGLFVSKGIVKAHFGKITVESEIGKGTKFTLSFPAVGLKD